MEVFQRTPIFTYYCMTMGEIHKLYPTPKDSHDGDIFLEFKKIFNQREK